MYESNELVRDQRHVENTPRRTDVIRFEATHNLIRVDRPKHLAQRAYCDVQAQIKAIVSQTDKIDLNEQYSIERLVDQVDALSHIWEEYPRFDFVLLRMCDECIYTPDTGHNESYASHPAQIYRLSKYLSNSNALNRATKQRVIERYVYNYENVESTLSSHTTNYIWRILDDPGQHIMVKTAHQTYLFPHGYILKEDREPFTHISVTRNKDEFASEVTRISIPITKFSRSFLGGRNPDGSQQINKQLSHAIEHNNVRLLELVYDVPAIKAQVQSDGFAYLNDDQAHVNTYGDNYYSPTPLNFVGARLDIGGVINFYERAGPFSELVANLAGHDMFAFNILADNMRATIFLPPVRFVFSQQNSLHSIPKRMCFNDPQREFGIVHHEAQFVECCLDVVHNLSVENFDYYFSGTSMIYKNQNTFMYDADPVHAIFIQRYKYDSRHVEHSLADYRNLNVAFQNISSDEKIIYIEDIQGVPNNIVIDNTQIARFELNEIIPDAPGQHFRSICVFEYLANDVAGFYVSPVQAYDDDTISFDINATVANVLELELLMGNHYDVQRFVISPGAVCFAKTHNDGGVPIITGNFFHNGTNAHDNGLSIDRYFDRIDSADEDDDGNKFSNLRLPKELRLAYTMPAATFLVHSDRQSYLADEEYQNVYRFTIEIVKIDDEDRQTLRLFDDEGVRLNAVQDFENGDLIWFCRQPAPYAQVQTADQQNVDLYPLADEIAFHTSYSRIGDRVVGYNLECSDPVICGPLSCAPQIDLQRPLQSSIDILPKKIGNYLIEYNLNNAVIKDSNRDYTYNVQEQGNLRLACEFVTCNPGELEETTVNCPQYKRFKLVNVEIGQTYRCNVDYGKPTLIYIEHDGIEKFNFFYRDQGCPVLSNADIFDYFKMFNRLIPKNSQVTFQSWLSDNAPILLQWQELGSWGQLDENQKRFELEFELFEKKDTLSQIDIYLIYEDYYLIANEEQTKFLYR